MGAIDNVWQEVRGAWQAQHRIPFINQVNQAECGLTCIAMVLEFHGRKIRLEQLREVMMFSRDGVNAGAVIEAARRFGLRGRGLRLDVHQLKLLPRGAILHWGFNHFVVLDRVDPSGGVFINDPASAHRFVSAQELSQNFTGVAIELTPGEHFTHTALPNATFALMKRLLAERDQLTRVLVVSALAQFTTLALPALLGLIVDRVLPQRDHDFLEMMVVGTVAMASFYGALIYLREQIVVYLRVKLDVSMVIGMLEHMLALPFSFFQVRDAGPLIARFQSATWIRDALGAGVLSVIVDASFAVLALAAVFFVDYRFGLVVVAIGATQFTAVYLTQKRIRELWQRDLYLAGKSTSQIIEMIIGIETLKSAGAEGRALHDWTQLYTQTANNLARRGQTEAKLLAMRQSLLILAPAAVLIYGTHLVLRDQLTVGGMLAANALSLAFLQPLANVTQFLITFGAGRVHAERLDDLFSQPTEIDLTKDLRAPRLSGAVEVRDVSFRYSPLTPEILSGVSLRVEQGAFVAIVGASGSGKTTLGRLLLGLMHPSAGDIRFDGVSLKEVDLRVLRQQVGVVGQQTHLFARTVRENVTLLDESVPVEKVERALELACVHEDVKKMPMGIYSQLAPDGGSLSGGQRQRVAIARALLREPVILLLDEATSALDAATERRVQDNLDALDCTRVVIAHRLSTIRRADLIVVMEAGKVVEQGTHDELIARNGVYARLVNAQLKEPTADA